MNLTRRIALLALLIASLHFTARAVDITVNSFSTGPIYQQPDTIVVLRLYYSDTIVDSTGTLIVGGPVSSNSFYKAVTCSLNTSTKIVTCPTFTLPSTMDSSRPTATVSGVLYGGKTQSSLAQRSVIFSNWKIPTTLTPTTYAALTIYNLARRPVNPDTYYTTAQVDALIASAVSGLVSPDASTTTKGIAKVSVAPVSASDPIAVGNNDPRVPTQGENDALAGTSGTPGPGNRFVTDADTRLSDSVKKTPSANQAISGAFQLSLSDSASILWPKGQTFAGPNGDTTTSPVHAFIGGTNKYQLSVANESTDSSQSGNNPSMIMNVQGGLNAVTGNRRLTALRVDAHDISSSGQDADWIQGGQISATWFGSSGKSVNISRGLMVTAYPSGAGNILGKLWPVEDYQNQTDEGNIGFKVEANNIGSGQVNYNNGASIYTGVNSSGGITDDDTIVAGMVLYGSGTVGSHRTIHLEPLFIDAGTSIVNHNIGLQIEDQGLFGGARNPDPWNMKSLGLTARNLFAGPIILRTEAGPRITTSEGAPVTMPAVGSINTDVNSGDVSHYIGDGWAPLDRSPVNPQTGTTYTVLHTDGSRLVTLSNGSAIAATLPQAGSAPAVTDSFNRANGALGANWGTVGNYAQAIVDTNTFAGATGANRASRYIGSSFRANQSAQATIKYLAARTWLLVRVIDPASVGFTQGFTYYFAGTSAVDQGDIKYYIGKVSSNVTTVLATSLTDAVVNDVVKLEATGSSTTTLNLYVNGSLLLTVDDSSSPITSEGWPGLFVNTQTATIDTFDDFAAFGATIQPTLAFGNGWYADFKNVGAGTVTFTPTTSTINGGATYNLITGKSVRIVSDGTNYQTIFGP